MPKIVNLKVSTLRKRGYDDVSEWLADPQHLYIGKRMRISIHTKFVTTEPVKTKVGIDKNGNKILIRPNKMNRNDIPFDKKLLSYPVGSYVNKKNKIIHLFVIPKSKWANPFKVKKSKYNARKENITDYETYLKNNITLMNSIKELNNITEIGYWCTPKECHGDVILKFYNMYTDQKEKRLDRIHYLEKIREIETDTYKKNECTDLIKKLHKILNDDLQEPENENETPERNSTFYDGRETKMLFAVRTDLKMGKGKIAAQVAHCSISLFKKLFKTNTTLLNAWERAGSKKVVTKIKSEKDILLLLVKAQRANIIHKVILFF